jgi:hypothetical protein
VSGEMGPGGGCTPVRPGAGRRVGGTRSARSATGAAAGGGGGGGAAARRHARSGGSEEKRAHEASRSITQPIDL